MLYTLLFIIIIMQLVLFIMVYRFPHAIDRNTDNVTTTIDRKTNKITINTITIDSKINKTISRIDNHKIKVNNTSSSVNLKVIDTNTTIDTYKSNEVIDSKDNVINNHNSNSNIQIQLYPGWEKEIKTNGDTISFKRLSPGMDVSFWYSVEDTLHSAEYIQQFESNVVSDMITIMKSSSEKCNFIDIGSNGGFFSLLARTLGCRTIAVDAQPFCLVRLSSSASINGYLTDFGVKWGAVSDQSSLSFNVGATKCSGLWSASNESDWINKESNRVVKVTSISMERILNDYFQANSIITIMKIDAEGSEMNIIKSALPFLKDRRILNLIVEIVPNRVKSMMTSLNDVDYILRQLDEYNYEITSYGSTSATNLRSQLLSPQKSPTGDNMFKIALKK